MFSAEKSFSELRAPDVRTIALIFLGALLVRYGYVAFAWLSLGPEGLMGPDSTGYLVDGRFLANGGSVFDVMTWERVGMSVDHMPIPFVMMSWTLDGSAPSNPLPFVLMQSAIDALTCILIGFIAMRIDPALFLPAASLAAVNPTQVVVAGMVYTDTIFFFFVTLGLWAILAWVEKPRFLLAVVAGLGWGCALMSRPFVQYWIMLLPLLVLLPAVLMDKRGVIRRIVQAGVVALVIVAVASPIAVRNQDHFGTYQISPQSGAHLMFWVVPLVREFKDGTPRDVSKVRGDRLFEEATEGQTVTNPFVSSAYLTALAKQELLDLGVGAVASAWVKGAILNLSAPATTISPLVSQFRETGFYDTQGDTFLEKVGAYFLDEGNRIYAIIVAASTVLVPVWIVLALLGVASGARQTGGVLFATTLLVLWTGYTLAINGPVVSPKYRLPLEVAWIVFMAMGLQSVRSVINRHKMHFT